MPEKLACTGRKLSPNRWSLRLAAASASLSRSIPTSRPPGPSRSKSASAWPPPPRVQSTTTPPAGGASSSATSSSITVRCANPPVIPLPGDPSSPSFQGLLASCFPTLGRPDFDPVQHRDEGDFTSEPTFFSKPSRKPYAPLAIDRAVFCTRENGMVEKLCLGIEWVPAGDGAFNALNEMGRGKSPDSTIEECEHNGIDSRFLQLSTKSCRKGQATLLIELYGDLTPLSEHPTSHDRPATTPLGAAPTAVPPYSTLPHIQPI